MVPMRFLMVLASAVLVAFVALVASGAAGLLFWDITDALSEVYLGGDVNRLYPGIVSIAPIRKMSRPVDGDPENLQTLYTPGGER